MTSLFNETAGNGLGRINDGYPSFLIQPIFVIVVVPGILLLTASG